MNASTFLLFVNQHQTILGRASNPSHALSYDPYGDDPTLNAAHSSLGFNAQLRQPSTGFYSLGNGYRTYNPALRCFHSPDAWSPFGAGGINAYRYCQGDPVNNIDPTGHITTYQTRYGVRTYPGAHALAGQDAPNAPAKLFSQPVVGAQPPRQNGNIFNLPRDNSIITPHDKDSASYVAELYYGISGRQHMPHDAKTRSSITYKLIGDTLAAAEQPEAAFNAYVIANRISPSTFQAYPMTTVTPERRLQLNMESIMLPENFETEAFALIGSAIRQPPL